MFDRLKLFRDKIGNYCENYIRTVNTLWGSVRGLLRLDYVRIVSVGLWKVIIDNQIKTKSIPGHFS